MDHSEDTTGLCYPEQASAIKKNNYMVIEGRPCKVMNVAISKTGKHGHAKCAFEALDIFTGKKYTDISPSTHTLMVPHVIKTEYFLVNIQDDKYTSLMDQETNDVREDLKLTDDEVGTAIQEAFDSGLSLIVTVLKSMNIEQIVSFKENNK